mmetsp:Transcript_21070/g.55449  ORF Transcript_21070/g.55449 Transcript_21070/m.55449 type:complete len:374 (+) Transcript_21070:161-1282(+)
MPRSRGIQGDPLRPLHTSSGGRLGADGDAGSNDQCLVLRSEARVVVSEPEDIEQVLGEAVEEGGLARGLATVLAADDEKLGVEGVVVAEGDGGEHVVDRLQVEAACEVLHDRRTRRVVHRRHGLPHKRVAHRGDGGLLCLRLNVGDLGDAHEAERGDHERHQHQHERIYALADGGPVRLVLRLLLEEALDERHVQAPDREEPDEQVAEECGVAHRDDALARKVARNLLEGRVVRGGAEEAVARLVALVDEARILGPQPSAKPVADERDPEELERVDDGHAHRGADVGEKVPPQIVEASKPATAENLSGHGAVPAREALVVRVHVVAGHVGVLMVRDDVLEPPRALARLERRRRVVEECVHPCSMGERSMARVV